MKKILILGIVISLFSLSCSNFLDLVPDNVATLDMAFNMRSEAEKYLATCYSYMPNDGDIRSDASLVAGDELSGKMFNTNVGNNTLYVQRGDLTPDNNYLGKWTEYYKALRDCNIFLENVNKVPDLMSGEAERWTAEVMVLKAYYHFLLLRMYGPIPIIKTNLPINTSVEDAKVFRNTVDEGFEYIVELLDSALALNGLPREIVDRTMEMGRINETTAKALKAKALLYYASPLFNGNTDQAALVDKRGVQLFNQQYDHSRWERAMVACKEAIESAEAAGFRFHTYTEVGSHPDFLKHQLEMRQAFSQRWNSEIIWANSSKYSGTEITQRMSMIVVNPQFISQWLLQKWSFVSLDMVEKFYTENGVPIDEDKAFQYEDRYGLYQTSAKDLYKLGLGQTTIKLHADREPRFYAFINTDRGVWFGNGVTNVSDLVVQRTLRSELHNDAGGTSYYPKKLVNPSSVLSAIATWSPTHYPWPLFRLSDLYLMYAEAINEVEGPNGAHSADLFRALDAIRARAGLKGVKEAWTLSSKLPDKFETQEGMRDIVRQERTIELMFEGHRIWDLKRWKTAPLELNKAFRGWDTEKSTIEEFYKPQTVFQLSFSLKDYFWPIGDYTIQVNNNLVQNLGW